MEKISKSDPQQKSLPKIESEKLRNQITSLLKEKSFEVPSFIPDPPPPHPFIKILLGRRG
jgi:hypothetical protein